MKRSFFTYFLSTLLLTSLCTTSCKSNVFLFGKPKPIAINELVEIINNSISQASVELASANVSIEEAKIELSTAIDRSAGGGFNIIVKGSKNWKKEYSSTITYVFKDANRKNKINAVKFKRQLVKALKLAANDYTSLKNIDGLEKDSFTITVSFTVSRDGTGGISIEVFGVGVDGSFNYKNAASHTITLTFK